MSGGLERGFFKIGVVCGGRSIVPGLNAIGDSPQTAGLDLRCGWEDEVMFQELDKTRSACVSCVRDISARR